MRVWINPTDVGRHHTTNDDKREQICRDIDNNGFDWQVWAVAASGFFTDSYNLFATNVILPCLAFVYWPDDNSGREGKINIITLVGSCLGQLIFGFLADRYGRRKLYGFELIVVIFGTLGVAQSSAGYNDSMSILSWMMFWRFFVGVGIGAEYPLSAVITAEFAARQSRARMMAAVFIMQPIGQLMASLVGLIVLLTVGRAGGLHLMQDDDEAAKKIVDSIWRWVIGVGAIPALIAIGFRLTIPESPRYTLDVDQDGARALRDTEQYLRQPGASFPTADDDSSRPNGLGLEDGTPGLRPLPRAHYDDDDDAASAVSDGSMDIIDFSGGGPVRHSTHATAPPDDDDEYDAGSTSTTSPTHPNPFSYAELKRYFWTEGNYRTLAGTALTWFLLDLAFYGLGINNPRTIARLWSSKRVEVVEELIPSWANPADVGIGIYETLRLDGVRAIITDAAGSLVGSAVLIKAINYVPRRAWLVWSFAGMGVLFAVIGGSYFRAVDTDLHALVITLYVLVQLLFNLGPNTLTFILPAELFPTRYRATCHGISASLGKLGSIVVVAFLPSLHINDPHSRHLGYLLIAFAPLMGIGALVAWAWIPEVQGPRGSAAKGVDGGKERGRWVVSSLSLEELAVGLGGRGKLRGRLGRRRRNVEGGENGRV
ncbi:hypothetical protein VC83_02945 [Pseudogymnoascus destructans]|uniref:Major facilitator superfamily (MFS) profile domain-containing protein n=1 Tax=Pseudogymnoascus destructans TaxID=655981 RepID=A0A177AGB1_9PEZI|nr:uncharacterized protein VC83_02945 [Pseudogymnoascus destructans]OAF60213.1 hypothetical protein VC83_02945 [Pseudogymnoascus destructans]